jgi:hypothetical protein
MWLQYQNTIKIHSLKEVISEIVSLLMTWITKNPPARSATSSLPRPYKELLLLCCKQE